MAVPWSAGAHINHINVKTIPPGKKMVVTCFNVLMHLLQDDAIARLQVLFAGSYAGKSCQGELVHKLDLRYL